jgi:hypothetical protein
VHIFVYNVYLQLKKYFEAFPFHISPKKAQRLLSPWAAFISGNMKKVWPSAATIIPFLDLGYLRPARFHAVYFPAWFVTADVEASVTYKGTQVRSIPVS